jgi:outer membrane protein assembly factor BamA
MNIRKIISKGTSMVVLALLFACNITKNVPEGEYLLTKNSYRFKNIQIGTAEAASYTKQKTNGKFLFFFPIQLVLYNSIPQSLLPVLKEYNGLSKKNKNQQKLDSLYLKYNQNRRLGKNNWLYNFCYKNGQKPVLLDSTLSNSSAKNTELFYKNKGFFQAKVQTKHKYTKQKKAKVIYEIDLGKPHKINDFSYSIQDSLQKDIFEKKIITKTLIKKGDRFDVYTLTKEKERIAEEYRANGYYQFDEEVSQLKFYADSTDINKKNINLFLKVSPKVKSDSGFVPDKPFTYQEINIHTQKEKTEEIKDTLYRGYKIYTKEDAYKLKTYTIPLIIEKNKTYNENEIANTKRNIIGMDNFLIEKVEIKKSEDNDSTLVADIKIQHKKKNDIELFLESSYSELFSVGFSPGLGYTRRNIFRGGENLKLSIKGTFGTVEASETEKNEIFNAYQLFAQIKLIFPYLLFPVDDQKVGLKKFAPKTNVSFGTSVQNNIGLNRVDFSSAFDYVLSPSAYQRHTITPFGLKIVRNIDAEKYFNIFSTDANIFSDLSNDFLNYNTTVLGNTNLYDDVFAKNSDEQIINEIIYNQTEFINSLSTEDLKRYRNMLFRYQRITQDVLFNFLSYEYLYNGYENKYSKHPIYFSGKIETGGNVLGLLDNAFAISKQQEDGVKTIFGVPYSQYIKVDLDFRKKWNLSLNQQIIFRTFFGLSIPYGNVNFNPFEKTYFSGGSNDVRAWRAYSLGVADNGTNFGDFAVGDLKLTTNLEYRFKMAKKTFGTFFVDAGNIWTINTESDSSFKFNSFYNQLGIGPGTGIRYDLTYLILRFDWAYKLHDPSLPNGHRWNIQNNNLGLSNTTLNFSINYPF